ncbi:MULTISPECIES: Lrp/AsnC family transcriptional regulator [Halorubrum]|jgi:DNA-binding Lrp family transcriptional regulator|uniref:AsnC family transcriptional regulator n=1 Tax=Halorubrum tropicale TaxID=1765655 RepID=A0A0M9ARH8_9EURY|nr:MULTISPECIES: Lrp/AsnC family transcriptional regulator [Halorubrum]KOX97399.1 AsnC family transcriptional regulator [Halorubrum tropicale]RLM50230.1 winged helix-turn-helix transcriptional regulator [Halorubrum sp. Atlit-28R]TKX43210.1 winged helix-turn-helix transcriptional regulator [Halorubrum sp. ARQ200]TKX49705.1 winged helix-turn-helix transcriptional regulator [Halorubrum sp. ASP121]TKX62818.1 winged helix-turn-helix transcriptional regulator [Halorubrum sp. ASP1]
MTYRPDEIDRRILYYLGMNARDTSAPMIAEEVDVTPATVRNRINRLEEQGVIRGYHADIDYENSNGKVTTQFTCTAPVSKRSALANEALSTPGVTQVRELLAGQENLVVTAVGEDTTDINRIAQQLSSAGVTIEREDIVLDETFQPYHEFAPEEDRAPSAVTDFQTVVGGGEVVEFTVSESADVAGLSLETANQRGLLSDEVLVVGIERDGDHIAPNGDTRIKPGDLVSVFSPEALPERLVDAFDGDPRPANERA